MGLLSAFIVTFSLCCLVLSVGADIAALFGVTSTATNGLRTKLLSTGDVVVAGYTTGSFSGFTNAGSDDFVIQKYSSTGTLIWRQQIGSTGSDQTYGLDIDTSDNIYISGSCSAAFDGNTYAGSADVCFIKYTSSGTKVYSGQIGGTASDFSKGLAVDSTNGYFYVVGETSSSTFDGVTRTGSVDQIWLKYDTATGTKQVHYQPAVSSSSVNTYTGIALDSSGNSWIVGYSSASTWMSQTSTGLYDLTLQEVSAAGSSLFAALKGGSSNDYGTAICVDSSDNVYVTGYSTSTTIDDQTSNGGTDILIVKYNSAGTRQYTILAGGSSTEMGLAIAVDETNSAFYVSGSTTSSSFYGSTVTGTSNFLLAYKISDGTRLSASVLSGTSGSSTGYNLAVTSSGVVYVTGYTTGNYYGQTLTGTRDGFLLGIGVSTAAPTTAPTAAPSATPTVTPSATPTADPTANPSATPTADPTANPTAAPTAGPTATPTATPTAVPTADPTAAPTAGPTATANPTAAPTAAPTAGPTASPTAVPTADPTAAPTAGPTASPTAVPTADPTAAPTAGPTATPTAVPTADPTAAPTAGPTFSPTAGPTAGPTAAPTAGPTASPTAFLTADPSAVPTAIPTPDPTANPTYTPTKVPTVRPTRHPSAAPTISPSAVPTVVAADNDSKLGTDGIVGIVVALYGAAMIAVVALVYCCCCGGIIGKKKKKKDGDEYVEAAKTDDIETAAVDSAGEKKEDDAAGLELVIVEDRNVAVV